MCSANLSTDIGIVTRLKGQFYALIDNCIGNHIGSVKYFASEMLLMTLPMTVSMNDGLREVRGIAILARGSQIVRLTGLKYKVRSQSRNGVYLVSLANNHKWICECPDHFYRHLACKHIHAVLASLNIRQYVASQTIHKAVEVAEACRFCGSSNFLREGHRRNKGYELQRYRCGSCGKWFVLNYGFERMRYDPNAITACIDLYFKGVSFRNIADHLKQFFGRKPSCSTIHDWLKRYTGLAKQYVDSIAPLTSGFLHVDEMKVNIDGKLDWLWNLMDSDTRFWISSLISQGRTIEEAQAVFQDTKAKLQVAPIAVTHDGLETYGEAFRREFYTNKRPQTVEVRSFSIRDRGMNNRMERLNQTFRDRNKTQRGLDHKKSAQEMADAIRVAYNFTRPHAALDGKTPAEASGINLGLGQNRWKSLIEKSARAAETEQKPKPAD